MLIIIRALGLPAACLYGELPPWYRYRYLSSAARHLFYKIPQRGEFLFFDSLRKTFVASSLECNRKIFLTESVKHSNAHEALDVFCQINASGTKPTRFILCTALNSCAKTLNWHIGLQIHARIVRTGYEENLILNSALVDLYAKCGAIVDARRVFDGMEKHDQVSWTSIIAGLSQNGHGREAISKFRKMLGTDVKPNCFTYASAISASTGLENPFEQTALLHAHVLKLGFNTNSYVASALVDSYSKCGIMDPAMLLFEETTERDNVLLNSMISGYSQNLYGEEALKLFMKMRKENLNPTDHSLTSILHACGSLTVLQQGRQVHSLVIKMGSESNVFVVTALIDMYSKCASIDEAQEVFDQTVQKNGVLWTSMIMGYAQSGRASDALKLFEHLITNEDYTPDHICFTAILTACNHVGFLDKGLEYFNKMRDYGLVPELDQYACLVDLYARKGHLRKARQLMGEMPCGPNHVMWSSFLSSCKVYTEVELGREAADKLFQMEPLNAAPYITMANIYAEATLWAKAAEIRRLMQQKGIRKSAGWSWIEIDKEVHAFSVGDVTHPQSQEIYAELEKLNLDMKEAGYMLTEQYGRENTVLTMED